MHKRTITTTNNSSSSRSECQHFINTNNKNCIKWLQRTLFVIQIMCAGMFLLCCITSDTVLFGKCVNLSLVLQTLCSPSRTHTLILLAVFFSGEVNVLSLAICHFMGAQHIFTFRHSKSTDPNLFASIKKNGRTTTEPHRIFGAEQGIKIHFCLAQQF